MLVEPHALYIAQAGALIQKDLPRTVGGAHDAIIAQGAAAFTRLPRSRAAGVAEVSLYREDMDAPFPDQHFTDHADAWPSDRTRVYWAARCADISSPHMDDVAYLDEALRRRGYQTRFHRHAADPQTGLSAHASLYAFQIIDLSACQTETDTVPRGQERLRHKVPFSRVMDCKDPITAHLLQLERDLEETTGLQIMGSLGKPQNVLMRDVLSSDIVRLLGHTLDRVTSGCCHLGRRTLRGGAHILQATLSCEQLRHAQAFAAAVQAETGLLIQPSPHQITISAAQPKMAIEQALAHAIDMGPPRTICSQDRSLQGATDHRPRPQ